MAERMGDPGSSEANSVFVATRSQAVSADSSESGRRVEKNFDALATHIPGLELLADHGEEPDLTRSQTRRLDEIGPGFVKRGDTIKKLELQQKPPHDEFKEMGIDIPGFRGARNARDGWEVQVTHEERAVYDQRLLDLSLGDRASKVVHKKVTVLVELDPDKDNVPGFVRSVQGRLQRQGSSARARVSSPEIRVDEEALGKMVDSGEVDLLPGTIGIEITKWRVSPRVIPSQADREAAEEKAQTLLDSQN